MESKGDPKLQKIKGRQNEAKPQKNRSPIVILKNGKKSASLLPRSGQTCSLERSIHVSREDREMQMACSWASEESSSLKQN